MRPVKIGNHGFEGKRTNRLGRGKGTQGVDRLGFVVGDGEEAVELHDREEVAHDRLDVEDNDLAAFGFDAAFQADEDGDARTRKIVDLGEVDGQQGVFGFATSSYRASRSAVLRKSLRPAAALELDNQDVGIRASAKG